MSSPGLNLGKVDRPGSCDCGFLKKLPKQADELIKGKMAQKQTDSGGRGYAYSQRSRSFFLFPFFFLCSLATLSDKWR